LITVIGILSGYGFSLIGRVCSYTGGNESPPMRGPNLLARKPRRSRCQPRSKPLEQVLASSMILADTGTALAETAGFVTTRATALLGITSLITPSSMLAQESRLLGTLFIDWIFGNGLHSDCDGKPLFRQVVRRPQWPIPSCQSVGPVLRIQECSQCIDSKRLHSYLHAFDGIPHLAHFK
jgi:hypothetical protein